jgi:hypothetical protein
MKVCMTPRVTLIVVLQVNFNQYGAFAKPYSFRVSLRNSPLLHKELDSFIQKKIWEVSYSFLGRGHTIKPEISIASVVRL